MKLQGPKNNGGFSHEGITYEPDDKDCIDVPGDVAVFAFSHGFFQPEELVEEKGDTETSGVNFAKMNKKQLIAYAKENFALELDEADTNKDLIAKIEAAKPASAE